MATASDQQSVPVSDPQSVPVSDPQASPHHETSFTRGLRVLTAVAEGGQLRADEIAAQLSVPLSTVYRYLKELRAFDLVQEQAGTYQPGWRLSAFSGHNPLRTRMVEQGLHHLETLRERTGRTAALTIREGHFAVCVRIITAPGDEPITFRVGEHLPLDRGAGQRALLAYAPPAVVEGVIRTRETGPLAGEAALASRRATLMAELAQVRRVGYVVTHSDLKHGAHALAAPVLVHGEALCSLVVASVRPLTHSLHTVRDAVLESAHDLADVLTT